MGTVKERSSDHGKDHQHMPPPPLPTSSISHNLAGMHADNRPQTTSRSGWMSRNAPFGRVRIGRKMDWRER
jgi:hypothetical protein